MNTIKQCSCGQSFDAYEWERLPSPPNGELQIIPAFEDEPTIVLSYRNCTACLSTMAIELTEAP